MARGEYVNLLRGSGRMVVRQRQLDILKSGGATGAAKPAKAKSPTVFILVRDTFDFNGKTSKVLGTFSTKTSAKAHAAVDYAALAAGAGDDDAPAVLDPKSWVNDKNNADTVLLPAGGFDVSYQITGKTLRK
jgi:hypothetical protein